MGIEDMLVKKMFKKLRGTQRGKLALYYEMFVTLQVRTVITKVILVLGLINWQKF